MGFCLEGRFDVSAKPAGLSLEGASWDGRINVSSDGPTPLKSTSLIWRKRESLALNDRKVNIPVYLDRNRKYLLFGVDLDSDITQAIASLRGVCLIAS